jgi:hypothetical protein
MNNYGVRDWTSRSAVAASFATTEHAEAAIRELKDKHFTDKNIGFAMRDRDESGKLHEEHGSHVGAGMATGAVTGGILGTLAGLLVGLGALVIPGVGPFIAGGVLASTLGAAGGAAAAGAVAGIVAGGIIGGLIGLGIPKHEAEYFDEQVREGRALVTVTAEGRADEAAYILEKHGGDTGSHFYEPAGVSTTTGRADLM